MKISLFLLCLSTLSLSRALEVAGDSKDTETTKAAVVDSVTEPSGVDQIDNDEDDVIYDVVIEENPDYVPPEKDVDFSDSDSDSESDYDDLSDDEEEDESSGDAKRKLSKKLKKAKKRSGPLGLLKKNRSKITLALAVFAFRKELLKLFLKLLGMRSSKNLTTDILKLLLFVDFMRRMQTDGMSSLFGDSDTGILNSSLMKSLGKWIHSNPAFVPPINQHFAFESLNEYYVKDGMALQKSIQNRHVGLKWPSLSTMSKSVDKDTPTPTPTPTPETVESNGQTVVILDWTKLLDQSITSMDFLRQQIAFLLSEYRSLAMAGGSNATDDDSQHPRLEVVVLLESPGGSVSEYGLAGQHLLRLRDEPGVTLTICVDKVAASGGYMLGCTASPGQLFAAPFAMLGSIGVIANQLNVNKLLNQWGVQSVEFRGGKYKAPLGLMGRITKEGKRVTQSMIDDVHQAFKEHVANARPVLKDTIEEIGNGNVWLGVDALELKLIDAIKTSDEYIQEKIRDGTRVFKMVSAIRTGFLGPRVGLGIESKTPSLKESSSMGAPEEGDLERFVQKSKTTMLSLPAQAKHLFSKSLQAFQ